MILFGAGLHQIKAQVTANCEPQINKEVGPWGTVELLASDIDAGSTNYDTLTLDITSLECDNIGVNTVVLTATDASGNTSTCMSTVLLEDHIPPVVVIDTDVVLTIPQNTGELELTADMFDNGSYDYCSDDLTFTIDPAVVTCETPANTVVVMTVSDEYGNTNEAYTNLIINGGHNGNALACDQNVQVSVLANVPTEIEIDFILEGYSGCSSGLELTLSENGVVRPDNNVTIADIGKDITAEVTSTVTGASCWGNIIVSAANCADLAVFCDTECRSTPIGDCASGHTDTDNIEWPCDIMIDTFGGCWTETDLSPQALIGMGVDPIDVEPEITNRTCQLIGLDYQDQVFFDNNSVVVSRTWTCISWFDDVTASYTQTITLTGDAGAVPYICDTLPWNAPITDCDGGHTDQDGVEWPADISVSLPFITPEQLSLNPNVNPNDVRPSLVQGVCPALFPVYVDVRHPANAAGDVVIDRKWIVLNWFTGGTTEYVQHITIDQAAYNGSVCAYLPTGEPLGSVDLSTGEVIGQSGCVTTAAPIGTSITASKQVDPAEGIDIDDVITITEHILGIKSITDPYKLIAADVSNDGRVSSLDVYLVQKMLNGEYEGDSTFVFVNGAFVVDPDEFWNYPDFVTHGVPADQNSYLVGIKKGDVNWSYTESTNRLEGEQAYLLVDDKVINKGERYFTAFNLKSESNVIGFHVELPKVQNLELEYIFSKTISDFSMENHVHDKGDYWEIIYYPEDDQKVETGTLLMPGQELFSIKYRSTVNGILSDELTLQGAENIIRVVENNEIYNINLEWQGDIVLKTDPFALTEESGIFPNPASSYFKISQPSGASAITEVRFYDLLGRLHSRQVVDADLQVDTKSLPQGTYILSMTKEDGSVSSDRVVIQR